MLILSHGTGKCFFLNITSTNTPFISHITYNSANKNLHILIMPSTLHNAHHAWIIRVLSNLLNSGHLTIVESDTLTLESGTSESACVPINSSLTQRRIQCLYRDPCEKYDRARFFNHAKYGPVPQHHFRVRLEWVLSVPEERQRLMDPRFWRQYKAGNPCQI